MGKKLSKQAETLADNVASLFFFRFCPVIMNPCVAATPQTFKLLFRLISSKRVLKRLKIMVKRVLMKRGILFDFQYILALKNIELHYEQKMPDMQFPL